MYKFMLIPGFSISHGFLDYAQIIVTIHTKKKTTHWYVILEFERFIELLYNGWMHLRNHSLLLLDITINDDGLESLKVIPPSLIINQFFA